MHIHRAAIDQRPGLGPWFWALLICVAILLLGPAQSVADDPPADLDRLERAFQSVTDQVSPSVVGIRARRRHFARLPARDASTADQTFEQLVLVNGSGTIIDADGLILTNEHVIREAEDITVVFHDGRKLTGAVYAADAHSDLAIVLVNRHDLTPARFCDWSGVKRGQWSIAIGNPFGLGSDGQLSVSVGVISNLDRQLPGLGQVDDRLYDDMIQTTAAINPGNSGGPLFNIRGELIGIVTAMHTRAGGDEGAGFAIPMTPARQQVIARLRKGESPKPGYLGLDVSPHDRPAARDNAGADARGAGVTIDRVEPASPAGDSGLDAGDLITLFDGYPINCPGDLAAAVTASSPGRPVRIGVDRGGRSLDLQITPALRKLSSVDWLRAGAVQWRGLRLVSQSAAGKLSQSPEHATPPAGLLVIDVTPNSRAARTPIQIGDTITAIDDHPITSVDEFRRYVAAATRRVRLQTTTRGDVVVAP